MKEQEIIDVVTAFMNGKRIESSIDGKTWNNVYNPIWSFDSRKYRIKPEPEQIPYDASDFFNMMLRDEEIIYNITNVKAKILWVSIDAVKLYFNYTSVRSTIVTRTFADVAKNYTHLNGNPLTKLK